MACGEHGTHGQVVHVIARPEVNQGPGHVIIRHFHPTDFIVLVSVMKALPAIRNLVPTQVIFFENNFSFLCN